MSLYNIKTKKLITHSLVYRPKKPLKYFIAFAIPAFIMLVAYASFGMFPFGDKSVLIMDMSTQYVEFFNGLKSILSGETTAFFSWNKAFGSNYIGVFAYYVSSPFSVITLFFPNHMMPFALMLINLLKIGCCGLTFFIFAKYKFRCNDIFAITFSCAYALMSYCIVYSMSLMWLDGVIWLPIILIGVEKLVNKSKISLLCICFSVLFISNYYISYMVAIGAGIYFILIFFAEGSVASVFDFLKKIGKFVLSGMIAAGIGGFFLLPTLVSLGEGKLAAISSAGNSLFTFNFFDFFQKLVPSAYSSIASRGLPNVFCGTLVLIGVLLFFFNSKIRLREKLISGGVLLFFFLSMWFKVFDFVWHIFQTPNWFPYRYSFICSFFAIYFAMKALYNYKGIKPIHIIAVFGIFIGLLVFLFFYNSKNIGINLLLSFAIFAFILLFFIFLIIKFPQGRMLFSLLILVVCLLEAYYNISGQISGLNQQFQFQSYSKYVQNYDELMPLIDQIKSNDQSFFRLEKTFQRSMNESIAFGYNGISHYSSAYNVAINNMSKKLGLAQSYFWNGYHGSTPLTDSLFDVKYVLSKDSLPSTYKQISSKGDIALYENPEALGLCFLSSRDVLKYSFETNFIFSQNKLLKSISGVGLSAFNKIDGCEKYQYNININGNTHTKTDNDNAIIYAFYAPSDDPIYMNLSCLRSTRGDVYINGIRKCSTFTNDDKNTAIYIGEFAQGEEVVVEIVLLGKSVSITNDSFYSFNKQNYYDLTNAIKSNGKVQEIEHSSQYYKAIFTLEKEELLATTIPFSSSWIVKIDGKKMQCEQYIDAFLCVDCKDLPKGDHIVEFIYQPVGLKIGIIITLTIISTLVVFHIVWIYRRKHGERKNI